MINQFWLIMLKFQLVQFIIQFKKHNLPLSKVGHRRNKKLVNIIYNLMSENG